MSNGSDKANVDRPKKPAKPKKQRVRNEELAAHEAFLRMINDPDDPLSDAWDHMTSSRGWR